MIDFVIKKGYVKIYWYGGVFLGVSKVIVYESVLILYFVVYISVEVF